MSNLVAGCIVVLSGLALDIDGIPDVTHDFVRLGHSNFVSHIFSSIVAVADFSYLKCTIVPKTATLIIGHIIWVDVYI